MCFHLKIYVILFNSFCVFLLEHIDVFSTLLLLPDIKNKTILQNKTEDRQLDHILQQSENESLWEFKILRQFNIINSHFKIIHFISLVFYKDAYLACGYIVILTDAKSFSSGTDLPLLYTSVKPICQKSAIKFMIKK